jgi:thymidylate synthase
LKLNAFMIHTFDAPTADSLWRQIRDALCSRAGGAEQAGRGGITREILHAGLSIADPRQRWVVSREPALNPAFAVAEVVWILRGRRDSGFLNYFNHQLCRYAGDGEIYHGAYGYRLIHHFGVDQLERAYLALRTSGESRQIVLQMWDASADLPDSDGAPSSTDVPCNISSLLKLRSGRLEWLQVMRSNDIFRGLPHNLVQFTTLQEVMAGWLGVEPGSYNHVSDSLHLYETDRADALRSPCILAEPNGDSLALPKRESDLAWSKLETAIERIIDRKVRTSELLQQIEGSAVPTPHRNLLCLLSAEGIRRRGENGLTQSAMAGCCNRVYRQLWDRWIDRMKDVEAERSASTS